MPRACPDRVWFAHALTLSRIPLAVLFGMVLPDPNLAIIVLSLAAATDLVDGKVARAAAARTGTDPSTQIGVWLDPLCDKAFVLLVLGALLVRFQVPLELLILIGARELILVPIVVLYRVSPLWHHLRYDFRAAEEGKHATAAQFVAISALLLDPPSGLFLAIVAAVFGVRAAMRYLGRAVRRERAALPA
jgi:cardiolipin synthase (CMP-forming)